MSNIPCCSETRPHTHDDAMRRTITLAYPLDQVLRPARYSDLFRVRPFTLQRDPGAVLCREGRIVPLYRVNQR